MTKSKDRITCNFCAGLNQKDKNTLNHTCYCEDETPKRCPQHSWAKNIKNCICGYPVNEYGLCTNPSQHGI